MEKAIEIENLYFKYENEEKYVIEDINFTIYNNEFVSIIGPNGGGKSTLIKLILGLLIPEKGSIKIFGKTLQEEKFKFGYVPQHIIYDNLYPINALDVVLMGRLKSNFLSKFTKSDYEIAHNCIKLVGMQGYEKKLLSILSGGQRQRILIARALAVDSYIMILDEPTANLDKEAQTFLYDLIQKLNKMKTIILVSHDTGFVPSISSKVICLNRSCQEYNFKNKEWINKAEFYNCEVYEIDRYKVEKYK